MMYSSFYQKQNGSDKAKKMTILSGQFYKLIDDGVSKLISCGPIRYNMLLLYTNIPETIYKVYSDNFQKLLDIKKLRRINSGSRFLMETIITIPIKTVYAARLILNEPFLLFNLY